MKKTYEKPYIEKVEFNYSDQVVVASQTCTTKWVNYGNPCSAETGYSKITPN